MLFYLRANDLSRGEGFLRWKWGVGANCEESNYGAMTTCYSLGIAIISVKLK